MGTRVVFTQNLKYPGRPSSPTKNIALPTMGGLQILQSEDIGYLINLRYVQRYIRGDGGEVILTNNKNIPVSRNKMQEFLNFLEKI